MISSLILGVLLQAPDMISIPPTVAAYKPIVARYTGQVETDTEVVARWTLDDDCAFREIPSVKVSELDIWAPPGEHWIKLDLVIQRFDTQQVFVPDPQAPTDPTKAKPGTIKILRSTEVKSETKYFTVTEAPRPPPKFTVPNVVGQTEQAAGISLVAAGYVVGNVQQEPSQVVAAGLVIRQSPAAGTKTDSGVPVDLVVSSGTKPVPPQPGKISVLILEETEDRHKLPREQLDTLMSAELREYLNAHCSKDEQGHPEWRLWDDDVDPQFSSARLKSAFEQYKRLNNATLPYIMISNGREGTAGALPTTKAEIMALLKKWGGE